MQGSIPDPPGHLGIDREGQRAERDPIGHSQLRGGVARRDGQVRSDPAALLQQRGAVMRRGMGGRWPGSRGSPVEADHIEVNAEPAGPPTARPHRIGARRRRLGDTDSIEGNEVRGATPAHAAIPRVMARSAASLRAARACSAVGRVADGGQHVGGREDAAVRAAAHQARVCCCRAGRPSGGT